MQRGDTQPLEAMQAQLQAMAACVREEQAAPMSPLYLPISPLYLPWPHACARSRRLPPFLPYTPARTHTPNL